MVLRFFAFALAAAALIFGCADIERDGPYDEKGTAYNGQRGDAQGNSSGGNPSLPSGEVLCVINSNCMPIAAETCNLVGTQVSACPISSSSHASSSSIANRSSSSSLATYVLTTSITPNGGGNVSRSPSSESYSQGTTVTVTATPSAGYKFVRWSGASNSANASIQMTMSEDKTLIAEFELQTYTLTTNATPAIGGTISINPSSPSYAHGTAVTVTATPNVGYGFVKWSGVSTSANASTQITMDGNKALTAEFEWVGSTFTDSRDGKTYKYVQIGTQVWMAENLNYNASGSKCYDNQESYCTTYGRLYDWATAMALPSSCTSSTCASQVSAKHQGVCPSGWHIPSYDPSGPPGYDEWSTLLDYAGGWETAGTKLKATDGWNNDSGVPNGTDEFGFAALPGGVSYSGDSFNDAGYFGHWWIASDDASMAFVRFMSYYNEYASGGGHVKSSYFSIRCLQD